MKNPPLLVSSQPGIPQEKPSRKSVLPIIACLTLGIATFLTFTVIQDEKDTAGEHAPKSARAASGSSKQKARASSRPRPSPRLALGAEVPQVDPRQVIESLSRIEPGPLTPENAEALQQGLLELVGPGRETLPALQEFFQKNVDRKFDAGPENLRVEPTLRIALMKVLFDLPTPDNVDLQVGLLRTIHDPDEIAVLARQLQAQEPGNHRESIIRAAQAALAQARNGQWPGRDTEELTEILEYHGAPGF